MPLEKKNSKWQNSELDVKRYHLHLFSANNFDKFKFAAFSKEGHRYIQLENVSKMTPISSYCMNELLYVLLYTVILGKTKIIFYTEVLEIEKFYFFH